MKPLLLTTLILISTFLFGQTYTTYTFKEIGWTIKLPNYLRVEDSLIVAKETAKGQIILENESHLELNNSNTKNLISASKDIFNQINVTLSKSIAPNEHYWDSVNNNVIRIFYNAIVKQASSSAKFDSSRTIQTIDGINFKCFRINVKLTESLIFHQFLITKLYKGSTLAINYSYTDESVGEEIQKMIRESKFKR